MKVMHSIKLSSLEFKPEKSGTYEKIVFGSPREPIHYIDEALSIQMNSGQTWGGDLILKTRVN